MNFFQNLQERAQQAVSAATDLATSVGADAYDKAQVQPTDLIVACNCAPFSERTCSRCTLHYCMGCAVHALVLTSHPPPCAQ